MSVRPTTGDNLVGLWRPSFTRDRHKVYIFGGGGVVTDQLHVLDMYTCKWSIVRV
jgi:hypothetical protein